MTEAIKIDIYLYALVSRFLDRGIKNRIENRNHKIAFIFMDKKILPIIILVMVIGLGISGLLVSQNILRRRSSKKIQHLRLELLKWWKVKHSFIS